MKKFINFAFILLCCLFMLSAQELKLGQKKTEIKITNHSFLSDEHVGSEIKITGLLTATKNTFVLTENPDSKSVVTFNLVVKKWGLKSKLRKLNGQTVTLTGTLTQATSTWTKKMKVKEITQQ